MHPTATALSLLRDMSAAEAGCNNVLQQIDDCLHKTQFGAGRRRTRSAARRMELEEVGSLALFDSMNEYLEGLR